jgi:hypothetical protein
MPSYKFPSEIVYWTRVNDHENIKPGLLQKINEIQTNEKLENPFSCKMTTNFGKLEKGISSVHNFLDGENIQKIILEPFKNFLRDTDVFQIKPTGYNVYQYWFNQYSKGDFQELHDHCVSNFEEDSYPLLSGIYILKSEEKSNNTTFEIKNKKGIPFHPTINRMEFDTSDIDDIKEGTVLIFSSTLSHKVKPIEKEGRITIAFNLSCKFN